ncbi:MAG: ATP-binding cassette domain-containing protein, partial [Thermoanaerobaculia bacterium]
GAIYGFLGPNGAGKTTTIRVLMDIYKPDDGEVLIDGLPPGDKIQHRIGYLPEERGLYRKMKVYDQLLFFAELKKVKPSFARKKILDYLDKFGLIEWKDKKVETLSKGMQQKLQFIGCILHNPDILILDEPFTGLDPLNQQILKEEIHNMNKEGKTIIFSTHILLQAEQIIEKLMLINKGEIVLEGNLKEIKEKFAENRIRIQTNANENDLKEFNATVLKKNDFYQVTLPGDISHSNYLQKIISKGINIESFTMDTPNLEEIFLKVVRNE